MELNLAMEAEMGALMSSESSSMSMGQPRQGAFSGRTKLSGGETRWRQSEKDRMK